MLYGFKATFQKIAAVFSPRWMTANLASFFGTVFVVLVVVSFSLSHVYPHLLFLVPIFIFFRIVMNALDGLLARKQNTASAAGEIMNELLDIGGDTACYGVLYFIFPVAQLAVVTALLSFWFCEFISVLGKSLPHGHRRQESLGGGKSERAVYLSVFAIWLVLSPASAEKYLNTMLAAITTLTVATGLNRCRAAIRAAKGKSYQSATLYGQ